MRTVAEPEGWPTSLPPLVSVATSPAEAAAELSAGVQRVRQAAGWQARPPADPSSYDILHERVCQLYVADKTFPSWWEAVNWAGETFRAFRIEHKLDASGVAALLTQGRMAAHDPASHPGIADRLLFQVDLRRPDRQGSRFPEGARKSSATVSPSRGLGRASPLFFRVVPLAGTPATYSVLMGVFRSRLLPDHEMTVKPGDFSIRPVRDGRTARLLRD